MSDIMAKVKEAALKIEGLHPNAIEIGPVVLEAGAIGQIAPYLLESCYRKVVIAVDNQTYEIAGRKVEKSIAQAGIEVHTVCIDPNAQGDVIADEDSLIQLILQLKQFSAEAVIAVGSGTLHDITRFSAYTIDIPFVSVPTAPSVDGFNSQGAPLILRGDKKTIVTIGPSAIFADLDILTKAPSSMVAAGFGDMLGKYTSLFDWKYGSLTGGEPYSPVVADMTKRALLECVEHVDEIAARTPEGIKLLMGALLESGFAMLLFGQSHPASGAEHHLSHYWEMEFLRIGRRQILHGAKVGVACAQIAELYHQLEAESLLPISEQHRQTIRDEIRQIPDAAAIRRLLKVVGGPSTLEELDIDEDLLQRSLKEAHHIRPNRYTLLKAFNEQK
ncbi:MAG: sn-glycerol-1-phosphate dehydrogenase [Candidatus Pristimantibacillus sp.]